MRKIKLGLVGCGAALNWMYGPFFRYLKNGELFAAMDVDETRAKRAQELYGAKRIYTDLDEMLEDEEIEAVIIATPTQFHLEQVIKAAKAGKQVYCEKPMARTIEEADAMLSACKENKVKLVLGFMKRFNKSFRLIKETIEQGRLGDVFEARATWDNARAAASAQAGYRHSLAAGGGFLQEDGSHPIDLLRWWLGEVEEVSGNVMIVAADRFENEDVASVVMKHRGGQLSSLHITMLTHCTGEESYAIFGTKGTLVAQFLYHSSPSVEPGIIHLWEKSNKVTDLTLSNSWSLEEEIKGNWQYLKELEHFCDCLLNDKEPAVTGADGRAVVEIINAAYLSSWQGVKVKLPLKQSPDLDKFFKELRAESKWQLGQDIWWSRY